MTIYRGWNDKEKQVLFDTLNEISETLLEIKDKLKEVWK